MDVKAQQCIIEPNSACQLNIIKILSNVFNARRDIGSMSSEDLNGAAKNVIGGMNVGEVMKEAKSEFKRRKEDGSIGSVKVDQVNDN